MYCPNCNKEKEGNYCTICGTKLIEKPSARGFNLNIGEHIAFLGGDVHNCTTYKKKK